ncbi:MAG: radical SAM family heme chaperone HemW [Ruminococcus sp.]|uniref:radical SAM family heme chaperone HemW n=1 Tax=Ruminococcus sp. TaxID=41978 RepID=UPI0025F21DFF|nr:radical SAM family heme chaperone HemW [Ruminococcus sp.]MCR5541630.1 radical SAM family heme chaperone HemW [Ruminococcus sp.]
MTGIYVHVPFCIRKCPYCSFYSKPYDADTASLYVEAVYRNIAAYSGKGICADTLYFGGGTPSLLDAGQISRIIEEVRQVFLLDNTEITIEANPCSVDEDKLRGYHAAGVNRISFGIQSTDDSRLGFLGRLHDFKTAVKAVETAHAVGFENISADIMLGAAGETSESLKKTIDTLCDLPVKHISAYMLKIEEGTAFDNDKIKSLAANDDLMSELYLTAVERLEEHGLKQYEISNFCREGYESRHNNKYWTGEDYLGFGPAAHSFFEGVRYCCPPDTEAFINAPVQPREVTEESVNRGEEYILLGLRLCKGISLDKAKVYFGDSAAERLLNLAVEFSKHGLVNLNDDNISLTPQGFLLSNGIISQFIDSVE